MTTAPATVLTLLAMASVLVGAAWLVGGPLVVVAALATLATTATVLPDLSADRLRRLLPCRPVPPGLAAILHHELARLTDRAPLAARPHLLILDTATPTAFAFGTSRRGYIALSHGLLRLLDARQLQAVLAHEIAHLRADDLPAMALAALATRLTHDLALAGLALTMLALPVLPPDPRFVLVLAASPTLMALLQLALSRAREHQADRTAIEITGDPAALATALMRLDDHTGRTWEQRHHAVGRRPRTLLSTHPPTAERVRRLRHLARSGH